MIEEVRSTQLRKKDDLKPDYKFVAMGDSLFVEFGKNTSLDYFHSNNGSHKQNTGRVNNSPRCGENLRSRSNKLAGIVGEKDSLSKRGMTDSF